MFIFDASHLIKNKCFLIKLKSHMHMRKKVSFFNESASILENKLKFFLFSHFLSIYPGLLALLNA
jgi:hypothetical protein